MGRGGGRSKASSTGTTYEAEATFIPVNLNTSLLEFLLTGHFETDYFSYCSNRLTDYTCRYWFDPSDSDDTKSTAAYSHPSSWSYPQPSQATSKPISATGGQVSLKTHSQILQRFRDPTSIPVSLTGGIGSQGWSMNPNETTLFVNDLLPIALAPNEKTSSAFLLISFLLGIASTIFALHCLRRISHAGLHIARILIYITVLEIIDLLIEFVDEMTFASRGYLMFTLLAFLGRWSCQTLAMGYSCLKHTEGLLFGALGLDVLIFFKTLRHHIAHYRAEWAYNLFIFIVATMATVNSQFFWTFDLFHVDNRIPPTALGGGGGGGGGGSSVAEQALYICGFSSSWGLSHAFISYIWPIVDHLFGEVIPCLLPIIAGCVWMAKSRCLRVKETRQPSPQSSKQDTLEEIMRILPVLLLLQGISILPRMLFYAAKFFVFSETYINRVGLIFHREDVHSPGSSMIKTAIAKVIYSRSIDVNLVTHIQCAEVAVRFFQPISAIIKSLLIILGFSKSRRILREAFRSVFRLRRTRHQRKLECARNLASGGGSGVPLLVVTKVPQRQMLQPTFPSTNHCDQNNVEERSVSFPPTTQSNNRSRNAKKKNVKTKRSPGYTMERVYRGHQDDEIEEFSV